MFKLSIVFLRFAFDGSGTQHFKQMLGVEKTEASQQGWPVLGSRKINQYLEHYSKMQQVFRAGSLAQRQAADVYKGEMSVTDYRMSTFNVQI